ncbi:transposase [Streptomyces noursei]|uniref:transposase n=1 Tax=Streptomyces noursei TaxID=1971 RepID=UPI000D1CFD6F
MAYGRDPWTINGFRHPDHPGVTSFVHPPGPTPAIRTNSPSRQARTLQPWSTSNAASSEGVHHDAIRAALITGLSNGLIESTNTKTRLIIRRGFGFHTPPTPSSPSSCSPPPAPTPHSAAVKPQQHDPHIRQESLNNAPGR